MSFLLPPAYMLTFGALNFFSILEIIAISNESFEFTIYYVITIIDIYRRVKFSSYIFNCICLEK